MVFVAGIAILIAGVAAMGFEIFSSSAPARFSPAAFSRILKPSNN